ncbi:hypothetical protein MNV49_004865 [Pseudohyphozyma bogoriensis]|nr:hypothetical protein MNV49_004865 [Pseudohyphozyma bogoriensis]
MQAPQTPWCLGNYKSWICVNGLRTPVYAIKKSDTEVEAYIESKPGGVVSVHWMDNDVTPKKCYLRRLYVDGVLVSGLVFYRDLYGDSAPGSAGRVENITDKRVYVFNDDAEAPRSDIKLESMLNGKDDAKDGAMELRFYEVGRTTNFREKVYGGEKGKSDKKRGEKKAPKGICNQVLLGPSQYYGGQKIWSCDMVDQKKEPYCTFKFRYVSREHIDAISELPAYDCTTTGASMIVANDENQSPNRGSTKPIGGPGKKKVSFFKRVLQGLGIVKKTQPAVVTA